MPELGSTGLKAYTLPGVKYTAPRTQTFTPTEIVPDLRGAAALQGSAASMAGVADVISKMPELMAKAEQQGRQTATARKVHDYKMDKLSQGDAALEDFTFGADDTLSYKYTDPALRSLKYDDARAMLDYRKAATERARRPSAASTKTTLFDQVKEALLPDGTVNPKAKFSAPIEPPLPDKADLDDQGDTSITNEPPPQIPPAAANASPGAADAAILPPLGGDAAAPITTTPQRPPAALSEVGKQTYAKGALSPGNFSFGASANPADALPNPSATSMTRAAPPPPPTPAPPPPKPSPHKDGMFYENGVVVRYRNGEITQEILPGSNRWERVPKATAAEGFTFETDKEAKDYAEQNDMQSPTISRRGGKTFVKEFVPKEKSRSKLTDSAKKELGSSAMLFEDMRGLVEDQKRLYEQKKVGPTIDFNRPTELGPAFERFKMYMNQGDEDVVKTQGKIAVGLWKIARLLNGPGVLTEADLKAATAVAPSLNESPTSFRAKMLGVMDSLSNSIRSWQSIQGAGAPNDVREGADNALKAIEQEKNSILGVTPAGAPPAAGSSSTLPKAPPFNVNANGTVTLSKGGKIVEFPADKAQELVTNNGWAPVK